MSTTETEAKIRMTNRSKICTMRMTVAQTNRLAYKDMNMCYYLTATLIYYGIQMGGAIIVTDVSTIFDFASAIAITALAFIFPGLFYLKAEAKYLGNKPKDHNSHRWAVFFIVTGIFNFCLGMFSAVYNVVTKAPE